MPAFSRLQLAQALLEYDNDTLPPEAPRRSAQESAIFAHLRRTGGPARPIASVYSTAGPRRSADYLGVKLPHSAEEDPAETELGTGLRGSVGARRSIDIRTAQNTRKSMDVLTSDWTDKRASKVDPSELGYLGTPDEEEEGPEGGMDLSSWGLDKYVVKPGQEKEGTKLQQHAADRRASVLSGAPSDILPNPFARTPTPSVGLHTPGDTLSGPPKRPTHAHRHSDFGAGHAFLDAQRSQDDLQLGREPSLKDRRRSVANPLDLAEYRANGPHVPLEKRRQSVGILPSESIPFPSAESPAPLSNINDQDLPNPFAVPAPPQERLSRFDPKAQQSQSQLGLSASQGDAASVRTGTMREGTGLMRTYSNASMGSRVLLDDFRDDGASYMTGKPLDGPPETRLPTRMELMRPKVLVMPSPLQGSEPRPRTTTPGRAGFMLSSDGTPLPPGAQSGARPGARPLTGAGPSRSSQTLSVMGGGFTPNPRASMSLSQLTFRNTLMVDGARDVAYSDIDGQLRRAAVEGEQVQQDWDELDAETEAPQPERPAGRLYGRSLMDDLQDRKAEIHGRQRHGILLF
ncbi:nuclear receptor corepressor 2 [Ceratobasidium sp. AG-Ba]|nr:nuclear receptor corepressor 2 [Ceratobasidium sp. AG-Ba]QRW01896.1 nuclear receptor corepressor 2 [Ceratobasidium sp. AG-Ba]